MSLISSVAHKSWQMPIVKGSSHYGLGAYAASDLAEGTVVIPEWNESFYDDMEGWVSLRKRQVLRLPDAQRELFLRYGLDQDFDQIVGPLHIDFVTTADNFINHSCAPNLRFDPLGNVVAAHDICRGDQVTVDYGCFIVNFDETFECRCGSPTCRGRIRRKDWTKLVLKYGMNMPRFLHERIARWIDERKDYAPPGLGAPGFLSQHRASEA